jgi:hypothetical protein
MDKQTSLTITLTNRYIIQLKTSRGENRLTSVFPTPTRFLALSMLSTVPVPPPVGTSRPSVLLAFHRTWPDNSKCEHVPGTVRVLYALYQVRTDHRPYCSVAMTRDGIPGSIRYGCTVPVNLRICLARFLRLSSRGKHKIFRQHGQ